MSKFLSGRLSDVTPYVPGEQPRDMQYVKLNTNESPFPPSPKALAKAAEASKRLHLYSDPECRALREAIGELIGQPYTRIMPTNGSDEILNFAFMTFCDENTPAVFPDISYGFYQVFAELNHVPARIVPLRDDFTIAPEDYFNAGGTVIIANPNAPTGLRLTLSQVEAILEHNRDNVVVIDEAYVDFGGESAVDFGGESAVALIDKYDNLLVTQTFSKSRSMAGARLGFGAAQEGLIADLNTIKYSTNPYNVNAMTMAAGLGSLADEEYTRANCRTIIENREYLTEELRSLGFTVLPSSGNFVFAEHPTVDGGDIYTGLKSRGVLVRHFTSERIKNFNRITIGTREQIDTLLSKLREILEEKL